MLIPLFLLVQVAGKKKMTKDIMILWLVKEYNLETFSQTLTRLTGKSLRQKISKKYHKQQEISEKSTKGTQV